MMLGQHGCGTRRHRALSILYSIRRRLVGALSSPMTMHAGSETRSRWSSRNPFRLLRRMCRLRPCSITMLWLLHRSKEDLPNSLCQYATGFGRIPNVEFAATEQSSLHISLPHPRQGGSIHRLQSCQGKGRRAWSTKLSNAALENINFLFHIGHSRCSRWSILSPTLPECAIGTQVASDTSNLAPQCCSYAGTRRYTQGHAEQSSRGIQLIRSPTQQCIHTKHVQSIGHQTRVVFPCHGAFFGGHEERRRHSSCRISPRNLGTIWLTISRRHVHICCKCQFTPLGSLVLQI